MRASKSELADVFQVGWSAAIYKLYSEVFPQSIHILGMPLFYVLICMRCRLRAVPLQSVKSFLAERETGERREEEGPSLLSRLLPSFPSAFPPFARFFPRSRDHPKGLLAVYMGCGHEDPGVTSDVTVIAWMHMDVMQQYLIESQTHVIQIYTHCFTHCTKCENFPFTLAAGNLFTKKRN